MRAALHWLRGQPDRPLIILYAHTVVVLLYATHRSVSAIPFSDNTTRNLISSPIVPTLHLAAAVAMLWAIAFRRSRGLAAGLSVFTWAGTTVALYLAAQNRHPQLAQWAAGLASVITVAAVLMLIRWGVEDISEAE